MKIYASGGRALRDFRVLSGERCAGMEGTRGRSAGKWGDLRGLLPIQAGRACEGRQPRAVSVRAAETCAGQVLRPYGGDSGAHSAISRFRDSASDCLSSRGLRKTRSLAVMFHVKQFLFLPMFHVKQPWGFSARQTAARPVPPPACHSERSEESPNFEANPSFTCGDSSPQAPQNDTVKRTARVSRPE